MFKYILWIIGIMFEDVEYKICITKKIFLLSNESDGPIPPISTKWAITSHPNSLNTKTTMTYDIGNPVPGLGQTQICGEGIPTLPSCTGSPTSIHIYKQTITKTYRDSLPL